jgi:hypothetical protein
VECAILDGHNAIDGRRCEKYRRQARNYTGRSGDGKRANRRIVRGSIIVVRRCVLALIVIRMMSV